MTRPEPVKLKRICKIWFCRDMRKWLCCADCWMRDDCPDRCLNWPSRCRCVSKEER